MAAAPLDDARISALATRLLKRELANAAFKKAIARSDADFDGAPIIRVEAVFDKVSRIDAKTLSSLAWEIHEELEKKGDDRLVFLMNRYLEEEAGNDDADESIEENQL